VAPRKLSELEGRDRRRALLRTAVVVSGAWIGLIGLYYLLPATRNSGDDDALRLTIGLVLVGLFLGWQTSRIVRAELPELRAAQALGAVIPLFLVVFSSIYLSIAHTSRATFSEPLDHTSALYFTITVFSTVGFGDITPRTDAARIVASIQMLVDLAIVGIVVRLLINAAKIGLARNESDSTESSS
jgi:voltage-gated potassium channel